jgi:hypothetical protein
VVQYHAAWREFFLPMVTRQVKVQDYQRVPRFRLVEEPWSRVAGRASVGLIGLLGAASLVAGGLQRHPVTGD